MSTFKVMQDAEDALQERLYEFEYGLPLVIGNYDELSKRYVYGTIYIDATNDLSNNYFVDRGRKVNQRIDGKFLLELHVPEYQQEQGLIVLADALADHFFPDDQPTAWLFEGNPENQTVYVQSEPKLSPLRNDGGYHIGTLQVDYHVGSNNEVGDT